MYKAISIGLLFIVFSSSCVLFKKNIQYDYLNDATIIERSSQNQYNFDMIIRMKSNRSINFLKDYGINGIQFVNLYDKDGKLLKKEKGEKCEINMMSFIKDSLHAKFNSVDTCASCHFYTLDSLTKKIYTRPEVAVHSNYKIVIGWAFFLNQYSALSKRTRIVTAMIDEIKTKYHDVLVIGLNLDPSPKE